MGIENLLEDAAGIFVAEKALDAVDPNANLLEKGIAAVAGVEGVGLLKDALGGGGDAASQADAQSQDAQSQDAQSQDGQADAGDDSQNS